jgi:quercetin dioxygenase-like cupin family protein
MVQKSGTSSASQATIVDSTKLKRTNVWGETDAAVNWAGAFALYGGHGTTASSTIVYEIEPGKRLGWHTDATEETQYIIAGQGKLYLEDGSTHAVGPGSVFVLPTRRYGTISRTPARKRSAPSPSSPRRCSRKTSTR